MDYVEKQFDLIKKVLESAKKSNFYKKKFKNIEVNSPSDFKKLPILTRTELYNNTYPKSTEMLTCELQNMIIVSTGGSSGIARYTVLTYDEWDKFAEMQAFAFEKLGITSKDIVANLFIAGSLWPSFIAVHDVLKKIGATHLPISANISIDKIIELCMEFQPTVIISLPTLFVFLADKVIEKKLKFKRLKGIFYAGEHMSKEVRSYISKALNVPVIRAGAYSSADAGLMGYQCEYCKPNEYHLPLDFQCLEIYNFEENRYCDFEEKGEILVTNLARFSMPIIKYRIGDLAFFNKNQCKCGDPNPIFTLCGRAGEDFKLGGAYISMGVFEKIIGKYAGVGTISMNYCLEIEDENNKMNITLFIEAGDCNSAIKYYDSIIEDIKKAIPEVEKGIEIGFIKSFKINFVNLGELERSPITGKIKKLKDKRVME